MEKALKILDEKEEELDEMKDKIEEYKKNPKNSKICN